MFGKSNKIGLNPRNSLVTLVLHEKPSRKEGLIIVPESGSEYCEATIVAVGPGNIEVQGQRSETFDLQPGMRVWVKHKSKQRGPGGTVLVVDGIRYKIDDVEYYLYDQSNVLAILQSPENNPDAKLAS